MLARSIRSHRHMFACTLGAAALALGACLAQNARADEWEGDEAIALPVAHARFGAPQTPNTPNERQVLGDVQWRRQGEASQWFARVSLDQEALAFDDSPDALLEIDAALEQLAHAAPRLARLVELLAWLREG